MFTADQRYLHWRKSIRSANTGNCVEVAETSGGRLVRDTKDRDNGMLAFGSGQWTSFVATLKQGRLDR